MSNHHIANDRRVTTRRGPGINLGFDHSTNSYLVKSDDGIKGWFDKGDVTEQQITIDPISPERHGDWHDKPAKWAVNGPDKEVQKFALKKDAIKYRSTRLRSASSVEAINAYSRK